MKKSVIALAVSGLVLASAAQAAPVANSFYLGTKAGWASFHNELNQFKGANTALNPGKNVGVQKHFVTYGIFGGYQLTDNIALELGYDDFGRNRLIYKRDTYAEHTTHGTHLGLKVSVPVIQGFDLYGRAAAALIRSDYRGYQLTGITSPRDGHDLSVSPVFAVGFEYALLPSLAFRTEAQWVNKVGNKNNTFSSNYSPDILSVTAGLSYRFGQTPAPVTPVYEEVTRKFSFSSDVLFDFGKASLKQTAAESLDAMQSDVATSGIESPRYNVAGYTDRIGSDVFNQKLSEKRAETVANYLVSKGVSADNVSAVGYGKANPVTGTNCDAVKGRKALIACLAPDRRVEVAVQGVKTVKM